MDDMNEMFRKECEEIGINYNEFPYDFAEGSKLSHSTIFEAMMWILKKRQDIINVGYSSIVGSCNG